MKRRQERGLSAQREARCARSKRERGVTLIELTVAITLVAALALGMLMAMRAGLITLEKTDARLDSNRRVMGARRILLSQLGGVMPVTGAVQRRRPRPCVQREQPDIASGVELFHVGRRARRSPHRRIPGDSGRRRNRAADRQRGSLHRPVEHRAVLRQRHFCRRQSPAGFVCAGRSPRLLPFCVSRDRSRFPDTGELGSRVEQDRIFPSAVRVEMAQAATDRATLPLLSATVPIHVTRDVQGVYLDALQ